MKRNAKTEKQKEFFNLKEQLYANWEAQRKLGYKPLEKPIHHGYDAYWVLRDDVARREDADKLQKILDNYGKSVWCKRKDFREWSYLSKRVVEVNPGFREIDSFQFEKLNPSLKKFFYSYQKKSNWGGLTHTVYVVNIPRHFLVRKVVKSYKTHYKVIDEVLKQEEAEINSILENNFYYEQRRHWQRHCSGKWWRKHLNRKDRAHNKNALRKNMRATFAKYDDINDDWGCWTSEWCDDPFEFKYHHKHYGKWWID